MSTDGVSVDFLESVSVFLRDRYGPRLSGMEFQHFLDCLADAEQIYIRMPQEPKAKKKGKAKQ